MVPLFADIMKPLNKLLRKDFNFNGLHSVSKLSNM